MIQEEKHEAPESPDLNSTETRKRLSPSALAGFFEMVDKWGIGDEVAQQLLGMDESAQLASLKSQVSNVQLERDTLLRISYLLGIFAGLNTLIPEDLAARWVSRPNDGLTFRGLSPLQYMVEGGLPSMEQVRRLLDAQCAGN